MSSYSMRERKDYGGGGSAIEGDCHEARADAMVRWSRSKSSAIEEGHRSKGLTGMCGRESMTRTVKQQSRS